MRIIMLAASTRVHVVRFALCNTVYNLQCV